MKNLKTVRTVTISIIYEDSDFESYAGSVELPGESTLANIEEAARGVIPMILQVAHTKFVEAKNKRSAESMTEYEQAEVSSK